MHFTSEDKPSENYANFAKVKRSEELEKKSIQNIEFNCQGFHVGSFRRRGKRRTLIYFET